jgi:CheY-like chemotaxis protein
VTTKQLLLVEDNQTDAEQIRRTLRMAGVANSIHHARTGGEALAFLRSQEQNTSRPTTLGIILIDLKLPDKTGFDILNYLQESKAFTDTTRVVVSQIENLEHVKRAYSLGADTFIMKPVNSSDLSDLIQSFPDHWLLVDSKTPERPEAADQKADQAPYKEAVHVWAKSRELIDTIRANLKNLQAQLSDNEETFAIIEGLTEELRNKCPPSPRLKKKPKNSSLL